MSCNLNFRIFKGRKVSHLPSTCDVKFVLLTSNCTLFRKASNCQHRNCHDCKPNWVPVNICEPYVFLDVCKDLVTVVNFKNIPGCPSSTVCTMTTTDSLSSGATASSTSCVISTTTQGLQNIGTDDVSFSQWNLCPAGSINGCLTNQFILSAPPGYLAEDGSINDSFSASSAFSSTSPDACSIDPFSITVNTPMLVWLPSTGSLWSGRFNSGDFQFLTDIFPTTQFGTNSKATQPNSLAMGLNSLAYLPNSMAHAGCEPLAVSRAAPPAQPAVPTQGNCQYLRVPMNGVNLCVDAETLCEQSGTTGQCATTSDIGCPFNQPENCLPTFMGTTLDCNNPGDDQYAVTDFIVCNPDVPDNVDIGTDLTEFCPYLNYTGTAFGTIDITAPRIISCGSKVVTCATDEAGDPIPQTCIGCPFGQRWCFVISRIQNDNEITHVVNKLEPVCGNNNLTGEDGDDRYTLCVVPTACDGNGVVRFCFRLIRNAPINTFPDDDFVPQFCATLKMTMIASGVCEKICEPPGEEPSDCFVCCPIPVTVPDNCKPQCSDCTLSCGSTSGSTTSSATTASKSTLSRTPFNSVQSRGANRNRNVRFPRSKKPCTNCGSQKKTTASRSVSALPKTVPQTKKEEKKEKKE